MTAARHKTEQTSITHIYLSPHPRPPVPSVRSARLGPGFHSHLACTPVHYAKNDELIFLLPRQAPDGKMYFLVLVTKFSYVFTQGSPTWSDFLFRKYDQFFFNFLP